MRSNYLKWVLLVLLLNVFVASAQNVKWAKLLTAISSITVRTVATDSQGNITSVGFFRG